MVLDGAGGTVLTHGDLHRGNVNARPGPVLAGVFDFNDVRLTDAHYDLVVVHLRALGADLLLLQILLDAYGWGPVAPGWREPMMALTIAHDFDELGDALAARPDLARAPTLDALAEQLWGVIAASATSASPSPMPSSLPGITSHGHVAALPAGISGARAAGQAPAAVCRREGRAAAGPARSGRPDLLSARARLPATSGVRGRCWPRVPRTR
jgi:hypothetical protein